jgi:hypothetical protein
MLEETEEKMRQDCKMATALGALLSGRREAARIINMTAARQ